jgi:hypothetical protein
VEREKDHTYNLKGSQFKVAGDKKCSKYLMIQFNISFQTGPTIASGFPNKRNGQNFDKNHYTKCR